MRKFPVLALLAVLLIPAAAEARTLWLKDAKRVTAAIAKHDVQTSRDPANTTYGTIDCTRTSATRATCAYTLDQTKTYAGGSNGTHVGHILCKRKVAVRLTNGHATGRLLDLNCDGTNDPDYEA